MYATRIPALTKYNVNLDERVVKQEKLAKLPVQVLRKADNYNNLHEQPQVFYAMALALTLLGDQTSITYRLAWTYTGLRVAHSLWHNLVNGPYGRVSLFMSSSFTLVVLSVRAAGLLWWSR